MNDRPANRVKQGHGKNGRPKTVALLADLAREHTAEAIQTLVQLMNTGAGNVRVMAANSILDRGWGKPAQTTTTTITEKRSALDWTTDELVAFLNEHAPDGQGAPEAEASDGAPAKKAGDREPDSVH